MTQAVNVVSPVNLDLEGNTAGGVQVPSNVSKLVQILVSLGASIIAVASAGVTIALRLTGDGLKDGQQDLTVGSLREDTTSTSGAKILPAVPVLETPLDIVPGNTINIGAAMGGVDPGSPEIEVTLIFQ